MEKKIVCLISGGGTRLWNISSKFWCDAVCDECPIKFICLTTAARGFDLSERQFTKYGKWFVIGVCENDGVWRQYFNYENLEFVDE